MGKREQGMLSRREGWHTLLFARFNKLDHKKSKQLDVTI